MQAMRQPTSVSERGLVAHNDTSCNAHAAPILVILAATVIGGACASKPQTTAPVSATDTAQAAQVRAVASSQLVVLSTLAFTRMQADGRVPGFNLDATISTSDDEATCNTPDFVAPDGTKGIDNRFASVVPAIEQSGLSAVEGLLQGAVDDGGLLIVLQVDGVDDRRNDNEVTVRLRAATGAPLLGTNGLVLAGQTFHLHPDSPESLANTAHIEGGVLHAGPFTAKLPMSLFGVKHSFEIRSARIRATLDSEGDMHDGLLGGGLLVDDVIGISQKAEQFEKGVSDLVTPLAKAMGDLQRLQSGHCAQISMALKFEGVSAFLWEP